MMSGSMLALIPGTSSLAPGLGVNTDPPPHHAYDSPTIASALTRATNGDYFEWLDHVWSAAGCTHPIRLYGDTTTIDSRTGEILRSVATLPMPDGVIYKACGNRRATVCPCCAEVYRRDAYQLIRSGLTGGKTIPASVAGHPAVFATFTAPSFGPVHSRHVDHHYCADRRYCRCRPEPCHARRAGTEQTCPHGIRLVCFTRHPPLTLNRQNHTGHDDGPRLGDPLCRDCYDYNHQAVWNNSAGELWRRTKQAIERFLIARAEKRGIPYTRDADGKAYPPLRVSHGKAAEYQVRGAVHFHALLRLDGIDPDDPDAIISPPPGITVDDLDAAVRHAATTITYTTGPHPDRPEGWLIRWGDTQKALDVRPITLTGRNNLTDQAVAAYLAKYATKGTEITGHTSRRLDSTTAHYYARPDGNHTERLIHAAWTLGQHPDWERLARWAHMLGFGGHFLTKARHYSITFTALRQARITYRRTQTTGPEHEPIHRQDNLDEETTLIIGSLSYAGTGWKTTGDALLANTAADQARRQREVGHEELAAEYADLNAAA